MTLHTRLPDIYRCFRSSAVVYDQDSGSRFYLHTGAFRLTNQTKGKTYAGVVQLTFSAGRKEATFNPPIEPIITSSAALFAVSPQYGLGSSAAIDRECSSVLEEKK